MRSEQPEVACLGNRNRGRLRGLLLARVGRVGGRSSASSSAASKPSEREVEAELGEVAELERQQLSSQPACSASWLSART